MFLSHPALWRRSIYVVLGIYCIHDLYMYMNSTCQGAIHQKLCYSNIDTAPFLGFLPLQTFSEFQCMTFVFSLRECHQTEEIF
jgi:hypothetical protein